MPIGTTNTAIFLKINKQNILELVKNRNIKVYDEKF